MYENQTESKTTAVLVAVDLGEYDVETSLAELEELAATVDIESVAELVQKRDSLDRATAIGAGKLAEVSLYIQNTGAGLVLFDHELTAVQLRNIEKACGVPVMDRTMLILEIFASRARSHEGKLQVELARNRYLLPRLAGIGTALSRLGGGGGGAGAGARRGKGETKLELDRRHLHRRITALEEQLRELVARRDQMRRRRKKDEVTTVAIVGYTNVGKSTLLNALTGAGVLAEDKLFATLDPSARALTLPDGRTVLLVDTVGLVRRLPHHLVEAFRSTLEEAVYADLILNVCDISSPEVADQIQVTLELLKDLQVEDTPILTVLNKSDKLSVPPETMGRHTVLISAATGEGIPQLLQKIAALLPAASRRLQVLIPYHQGGLVAEIREEGKIFSEEFEASGIRLDALVSVKLLHKIQPYLL
ncbi:MAG: GTPase HflX [Oscillospiraceae bacterium]